MESAREDIGNVMPAAKLDAEGWLRGVRRIPSPNCDARPAGCAVDLLVIHHITLPPGEFGGSGIIELFTNRLDPAAHASYATIAGMKVSAHFLIRRDGELIQFVACDRRAWHAGESRWKGRARCNDFSIGVELEGTGEVPFTQAQYARLADLTRAMKVRYPIADIVGHSDVAPGRKSDPGPSFDWARYREMIANLLTPRTRGKSTNRSAKSSKQSKLLTRTSRTMRRRETTRR